LILVNAIYFNGKWSDPFSPDDTHRAVFHGIKADRNVDMMSKSETQFRYYCSNGIRGIEIPYGNESLVMNVLIPEDTFNTIGSLYAALSEEDLSRFLLQLDQVDKSEISKLAFPKFEMEYKVDNLTECLKELGMKDAFDGGNADFDLVSEDLYVSQVEHMAKIQVEEWGTKAAAATAVMTEDCAMIINPLEFIVDVPFICFIRDKYTGAILVMGEINQLG
jgi:serpin B